MKYVNEVELRKAAVLVGLPQQVLLNLAEKKRLLSRRDDGTIYLVREEVDGLIEALTWYRWLREVGVPDSAFGGGLVAR